MTLIPLHHHLLQAARIQPVTDLLASVLPALGANSSIASGLAGTVVQPQAIQMYVSKWLEVRTEEVVRGW